MSRSLSRSSLAKSLLIDFLLTSVRLSHGDHARHLVLARGVSHHHDPPNEHPESDQPFLSIVETVIDEAYAAAGEDLFGIGKVQAVLCAIAAILGFVSFIAHDGM